MHKIAVLIALLAVSGLALAGPQGGKRGALLEELDLTEEQRAQIAEIRENRGGRDAVHAVLTDDQRARLTELRAERKKNPGKRLGRLKRDLDLTEEQASQIHEVIKADGTREEIRAVLTEEQQTKFDEMRKQRRQGRGKPEK